MRAIQTNFDFVGRIRLWAIISGLLVGLSILVVLVLRLNLSIDFVGGTSFTLDDVDPAVTSAQLQDVAEAAGGNDVRAQIVTRDDGANGAIVRMSAVEPGSEEAAAISDALTEIAGTEEVDVSFVGPTWGRRISQKALEALIVFLIVVVAYISIRLEFKMAVAAIVSLIHDVIITVGAYAAFGFNVSPSTIIALLTILGYSLYDTVVVFDRVEENTEYLGEQGRRTYPQMVNTSMNEVLWRSINTSVTSLLPVGALLFLGSRILGASTLEDLALALFVGMALGTYSSLFVAGPFLAWWKAREPEMVKLQERWAGIDDGPIAATPAKVHEARKPITTDYVRGQGRKPRRKRKR